ncbi:MAG: isopenicillin N synthase family dioxygenase [Burkholderiales bacterium]
MTTTHDAYVRLLDIAPFLAGDPRDKIAIAHAFDQSCRESGFIVITGHGVPDHLISAAFDAYHAFFRLPLADKMRARSVRGDNLRGYVGLEENALSYSMGNETPPDLFERYTCGRPDVPDDAFHDARRTTVFQPNIWSASHPTMGPVISDYFRELERLIADLLRISALALGVEEQFFADKIDRHSPLLSANLYPEQWLAPKLGQLRAGAHTDYGSLTILATEDRPGGLQVRNRQGDWIDVRPVPGSFIINVGDLMARWTNDRWVSTLHRVVNPPPDDAGTARRLSIVFFHHPNQDAVIECIPTCATAGRPAKYPPITAGEYIMQKFARQRADALPAKR